MFDQVKDAVVSINGLRELRDYLGSHVTYWNGLKVKDFISYGNMMYVRTTETSGVLKRHFYAYVDDAAHNVQKGFYESKEQ